MGYKEFSHDSVVGYDVKQEGDTLYIMGAEDLEEDIDFSDETALKRLATRATHTANGLFELIVGNCNIDQPDIAPDAHLEIFLSLAGLACEIYLKSLIYYDCKNGGKMIHSHDLQDLFRCISQEKQENVREKIDDIDKFLPELSKLFPCLRYDYEYNHIRGEYLVIFDLMKVLKELSNSNPAIETGSIRSANGILMLT